DPLLRQWVKGTAPLLALPPSGSLTGWRDPFLIGRPDDGIHKKWTMLVGAGHAAPISAGTALVYTSDHPTSGWEYSGELCRGNGSHGSMWECPLLAAIPSRPTLAATHMGAELSLTSKDLEWSKALTLAPPTTETKTPAKHAFIICPGPFPLDLGGATLYAPNLLTNDPLGRVVLWGRLWQEPLPAMSKLREEVGSGSLASWQADKINLTPNQPHALPPHLCHQSHLELEVTFDPPSCPVRKGRVAKSGLMLYPVPTDNQDSGETNVPIGEASGRHGAVSAAAVILIQYPALTPLCAGKFSCLKERCWHGGIVLHASLIRMDVHAVWCMHKFVQHLVNTKGLCRKVRQTVWAYPCDPSALVSSTSASHFQWPCRLPGWSAAASKRAGCDGPGLQWYNKKEFPPSVVMQKAMDSKFKDTWDFQYGSDGLVSAHCKACPREDGDGRDASNMSQTTTFP
ncbi:uncharacterized protein HaLaN_06748, partial [Haematococcus lacustris]